MSFVFYVQLFAIGVRAYLIDTTYCTSGEASSQSTIGKGNFLQYCSDLQVQTLGDSTISYCQLRQGHLGMNAAPAFASQSADRDFQRPVICQIVQFDGLARLFTVLPTFQMQRLPDSACKNVHRRLASRFAALISSVVPAHRCGRE
jgi:hypothetical protein